MEVPNPAPGVLTRKEPSWSTRVPMRAGVSESTFYRVVFLPAAVFLSVVFGGSYGSGQEVVRFVTSAGPAGGYVALLTVAIIWGLLLGTSFELARLYAAFEYAGFMRLLLGRGAFIYEIAILLSMVLVLAICASGAGTVLGQRFGIPVWLGSLGLLALAVLLNYFGHNVVERSMMASIVLLLVVLATLCIRAMDATSAPHIQSATAANPVLSGAQYAIVNGGFIPLLLFCGRCVRSRNEAYAAGFAAASVAVIPGILMHTSFVSAHPQVLQESLPAYFVISQLMPEGFLSIYVVVLFVMITQTAVGMVQGLADRADAFHLAKRRAPLNKLSHAALAAGTILASMLLASVGFVALIARGYDVLVVVFIAIFVIPLLTYGARLVFRKPS